MSSVKSSFAIAIGERGLLIAINLLGYVLVARLVSPNDVGVFSVASAFVAIFAIFRDFGSAYFIATKKDLSQNDFSAALTVSLLAGFIISLVILLTSGFASAIFEDQRVGRILQILSLNAPMLAVTGCTLTLLRRRFMYGRVFWVNLCGTLIGTLSTLMLALAGFGAYSLAIGVALNYGASAILSILLRDRDYRLKLDLAEWRSVASMGGKTSVIGVSQQLANSLLEIAVGKYLGFTEAGLISRAMGVVNLFLRDFSEAIRSVAIHSFSKEVREGRDPSKLHVEYLSNYSAFGFLFFSFVGLFPEESIQILSGDQWLDAANYLRYFAAMGLIAVLYQFLPILIVANGGINKLVALTVINEGTKLLLGAVAILFFGTAEAYGGAWLISSSVACFLYWVKSDRIATRDVWQVYCKIRLGLAIGLFASVAGYLVSRGLGLFWPESDQAWNAVFAGVASFVCFISLLAVNDHSLYSAIVRPIFIRLINLCFAFGRR